MLSCLKSLTAVLQFGFYLIVELRTLVMMQHDGIGTGCQELSSWLAINALEGKGDGPSSCQPRA